MANALDMKRVLGTRLRDDQWCITFNVRVYFDWTCAWLARPSDLDTRLEKLNCHGF